MSVIKAKKYYLGQDGNKRMNCALAVMSAFKESHMLSEEQINSVGRCGSGTAPGGLCGAYYAASVILGDKVEILEREFLEKAGSTKCREIRAAKRFSCVQCVEQSASIVEELSENIIDKESIKCSV